MVILFLLYFIASVFLILIAPKEYNNLFCLVLTALFLFQYVQYIQYVFKREKKWLDYTIIFLFSSFIVVYVYPSIIYGYDPYLFSSLYVDSNYINKGTALCHLLICSYLLGVAVQREKKVEAKEERNRYYTDGLYVLAIAALVFLLVGYIPQIGKLYALITKDDSTYNLFLVVCFTGLAINNFRQKYDGIKEFINNNKFYGFIILVIVLVYLILGIRYTIIQLLLSLFIIIYLSCTKINWKLIIPIFVAILLVFSAIRDLRAGNNVERLDDVPTDIQIAFSFRDMISCSSNIYRGMMYVDRYDYLYGRSFVADIFSPIPFLPSVMTPILTGESPRNNSTQVILTNYAGFYNNVYESLYGTNCFIDIWMNVGTWLSVLFFFIYGRAVEWIRRLTPYSIFAYIVYVIFVSHAIFAARGVIYPDWRTIIWAWLLLYIIKKRKSIIISNKNNINKRV